MRAYITDKKVSLTSAKFFCGDKNAERIVFEAPLTYNGILLARVPVYVKTKNALGDYNKTLLVSNVNKDKLNIDWTLGSEATAVSGELLCQVVFEKDDGTMIMNTDTFSVFIGDSVPDTEQALKVEPNYLTQLQNKFQSEITRLDGILQEAGYAVGDQMQGAVGAHNTDVQAHQDIRESLQEVKAKADEKSFSAVFESVDEMIQALNAYSNEELNVGDCIHIKNATVPDFYVCAVKGEKKSYEYSGFSQFAEQLKKSGSICVGYYDIAFCIGFSAQDLPLVGVADAGKILQVDENGKWQALSFGNYQGELANIISFTVGDSEYYAEEGMTWGEWVETFYNNAKVSISWGGTFYYVYIGKSKIKNSDGTSVTSEDLIAEGGVYCYSGS